MEVEVQACWSFDVRIRVNLVPNFERASLWNVFSCRKLRMAVAEISFGRSSGKTQYQYFSSFALKFDLDILNFINAYLFHQCAAANFWWVGIPTWCAGTECGWWLMIIDVRSLHTNTYVLYVLIRYSIFWTLHDTCETILQYTAVFQVAPMKPSKPSYLLAI